MKSILTKSVKEELGIEKLTPKQSKFLQLWLETGNGTQSAMKAYDTTDLKSASVIATENLAKLRNPMKFYLEHHGIGINKLLDVVEGALKAQKTDITGDVHPDHRIRLEASDRLSKWLDVEPKQTSNVAVQVNNIITEKRNEYGI